MEPLSFILDTFIGVMERIINLEKAKIQNKQQVFKEIIEPLFIELQPVIDNYITLFKQAKQSVSENKQSDIWEAVQEIRESRDAMILSRVKVREMANRIQEAYNDKKITDFAQKVDGFFYRTILEKQKRSKSMASELVDLFEYVLKHDMDKTELIKFIDDALKNMETSWVAIAQSYAMVRIYCLSSPQLINKSRNNQ